MAHGRWRSRERLIDGSLFVAVALAAQVETWAGSDFHPKVPLAALALVVTAPLLVRRLSPLTAAAAVVAGEAALGLWKPALSPAYVFVAMLVVCYSCGAFGPRRRALAGLGLVLALYGTGAVLDHLRNARHTGAGDVVLLAVLFTGVWGLGRMVQERSQRANELADLNEQLRHEREERARLAVDLERARIARELHDVIAHCVGVMVVQAAGAEGVLDQDPDRARAALVAIQGAGREAIDELRRMLGILRDGDGEATALAPQPGLRDLESLADASRAAGLDVALEVKGNPVPLAPGVDLAAYRIVQEALTNVRKHAAAASAVVRVQYDRDAVSIAVEDGGPRGGDAGGGSIEPVRAGDGGHGLVGMRERVALYGGHLRYGTRDAGGFEVHATLPHGVRV